MSCTLTMVTILSSCLRTCSRTASSPWTTKVMRERLASSVSPTARLSMLKPRDANMPETWASTPGWFCTRADKTWRILSPQHGRKTAQKSQNRVSLVATFALFCGYLILAFTGQNAKFLADLGKGGCRPVELFRGVCCRELNADSRLALGHDGETEADNVDAAVEQLVGDLTRQRRVAQHHGQDRVLSRLELKAGALQGGAELLGVGMK